MPPEAGILPHLSEEVKERDSNSDQSHEDHEQDRQAKQGRRKGGC